MGLDNIEKIRWIERRCRRLTGCIMGLAALWIITAATVGALRITKRGLSPAGRQDAAGTDILRVRGLVVADANGVERVRIGAPLPEPIVLGKRIPRGGDISGILLYDAEGNERSGYVTSEGYPNVFFTLDGLGQQHVLFITDPNGTPTLRMWNQENTVQLEADEMSPDIKLTHGKEVLFEAPAAKVKKR